MGISGNQSKLIKSLHQKKYRQKYNKFIVEGEKLVLESIRDQPGLLIEGFYTKNFKGEIPKIQNYFFLIFFLFLFKLLFIIGVSIFKIKNKKNLTYYLIYFCFYFTKLNYLHIL